MNRDEKTIFVSVLTVLLLAFSNFLNTGTFIFTFPINDALFLVVTGYFFYFHFRSSTKVFLLLLFFAICNFASQMYNYEFFFSQEILSEIAKSSLTDIFEILSYLLLIFILFIFCWKPLSKNAFILFIVFLIGLILSEIFKSDFLKINAFAMIVPFNNFLLPVSKNNFKPVFLLLVLYTILFITKFLTLYFL